MNDDMARAMLGEVPVNELRLELQRYLVSTYYNTELLEQMETRVEAAEYIGHALLVQMERSVWGKRGAAVNIQYPADWWQHFKQRWFPRWALRRWPAHLHVEEHQARALCPELVVHKRDGSREAVVYTFDAPRIWNTGDITDD